MLHFNSQRQDVKDKIQRAIKSTGYIDTNSGSTMLYSIQRAMDEKIEAAFNALIESLYSQQDLEKDLGL